jgi:hypothetical protein
VPEAQRNPEKPREAQRSPEKPRLHWIKLDSFNSLFRLDSKSNGEHYQIRRCPFLSILLQTLPTSTLIKFNDPFCLWSFCVYFSLVSHGFLWLVMSERPNRRNPEGLGSG